MRPPVTSRVLTCLVTAESVNICPAMWGYACSRFRFPANLQDNRLDSVSLSKVCTGGVNQGAREATGHQCTPALSSTSPATTRETGVLGSKRKFTAGAVLPPISLPEHQCRPEARASCISRKLDNLLDLDTSRSFLSSYLISAVHALLSAV